MDDRSASAFVRLRRSSVLLTDLSQIIREYESSIPWRFRPASRSGAAPIIYIVKPIPQELMLGFGDLVHELRCALDHAVFHRWTMIAGRPKGDDHLVSFPSGSTQKRIQDNIKDLIAWVPTLASDFSILEPWPNGKHSEVFNVCGLDNINKHRLLLASVAELTISGLRQRCEPSFLGQTAFVNEIPPKSLILQSGQEAFGGRVSGENKVYAWALVGGHERLWPGEPHVDLVNPKVTIVIRPMDIPIPDEMTLIEKAHSLWRTVTPIVHDILRN